jgi:hypothetical protein
MNNFNAPRSMKGAIHERERWWPADLGTPATFGSSEGWRYASFPLLHRLVVEQHGALATYDTASYQFRGVLQCRAADGKMSFLSQHGRIELAKLTMIG